MVNNEVFLQQMQEGLSEIVKPYQRQLDQQQKMAELVNLCLRHAGRDDFIALDELLKTKKAEAVENEESLKGCKEFFDRLRAYANEKVERYRIQFIEDLRARAEEAALPLAVDFPRLSSLKGIEATVDFSQRTSTINKKTLKSIDPRRIVSALLKAKRELYDRPFEAQSFVNGLHQTYKEILKKENLAPGHAVPVQRFYFEYVMSLQSKAFLQDMAKGKFRGYSVDQFGVDIWRYFQSATGGTSEGYALQLRAGRNNSLWLIDSDGEKRQITGISFQKVKS
ncbi:MAG: hypothetical protein Q8P24_15555 [Desulfobacterales bacterium]|nr:hypothetical protein [Desulfobacterales bacterium]